MPVSIEPKSLRVPEGISRLMRDLIHERTGLYFEDTRTDALLEKLEPLARKRGLQSFLEYYYLLKDNAGGAWEQAWDVLSVQETYFWREMGAINALTKVIVPEWFGKRILPFRIWSAACATGEEPYSIVMALAEAGFGSHPIEMVGQRRKRGGDSKGRASGLSRKIISDASSGSAPEVFSAGCRRVEAVAGNCRTREVRTGQSLQGRRHRAPGPRARHFLPERFHLLFPARHSASRGNDRGQDAIRRTSFCGRGGVLAASDDGL